MYFSFSFYFSSPLTPPFHLWPFLCIPFHFAFLFAFGLLAVRIHSLIHIHCALVFRGVGVFMPEIPLIHSKRGNAVKMLPKKTAAAKNETMAGAHKVRSGNFSVCQLCCCCSSCCHTRCCCCCRIIYQAQRKKENIFVMLNCQTAHLVITYVLLALQ